MVVFDQNTALHHGPLVTKEAMDELKIELLIQASRYFGEIPKLTKKFSKNKIYIIK